MIASTNITVLIVKKIEASLFTEYVWLLPQDPWNLSA